MQELMKTLIDLAVTKGAHSDLTKPIKMDQIVVPNQWVRWKCQFACDMYGKRLCCPPYTTTIEETRQLLQDYEDGLLIGFIGNLARESYNKHQKKMHETLLRLEQEAFKANYVKAFVLSTGICLVCKDCVLKDLPAETPPRVAKAFCRHKNKMRPSMEAVGIDVFGTVHNLGIDLDVISENNTENVRNFGLLLIE
ncbi:MAG: DUF2284 domain-containing protein [Candidatus Helarchaeota archaeon]